MRLDRGRILIMLPYNLRCPASVLIEDGRLGFKISMMEEPNPVTGEWLESHLGLVVFQDKEVGAQRKEKVFHQKWGDSDKGGGDRSAQINHSNHHSWKVIVSPKVAKVDFMRENSSSRSESSEYEEVYRQGQFYNSAFCRGENSKSCDGLSKVAYRAKVEG
ncbi:hypothetical protein QYF36_000371 [Acer negundo]|nr:hypothetical protein QYF36_000371 [Acer negundo]